LLLNPSLVLLKWACSQTRSKNGPADVLRYSNIEMLSK